MPPRKSRATAASGGQKQGKMRSSRKGQGLSNGGKGNAPQAPARRPRPVPRGPPMLPMYLKCILNPFDEPACGLPDGFCAPTAKLKLTDSTLLTTDAGGYVNLCVSPSLARAAYTATITSGTMGTSTYTQHPDYTTVNTAGTFARTVCYGVLIEYIGATMSASGTLTVVKEFAANAYDTKAVSAAFDDGQSHPALMGRKIPCFPTQSQRFEADNVAAFSSPTFPYVYIFGSGLPAGSNIRVTVVRHIEVLPGKDQVLVRGSATRTPTQPLVLAASAAIDSEAQSFASDESFATELSVWSSQAWQGLKEAAAPLAYAAGVAAANKGVQMATTALAAFGL